MTSVSTHRYTARALNAGGDVTLQLHNDNPGSISLDASRVPHVEGEITVAVGDAMLLEKLDPRGSRRVVVDVSATFLSEQGVTRSRSFNLGIREARPNRADGTVSLRLASDEALLSDFAPLADDATPRVHQASLRAVCNYVLGKIGAALQSGGPDADVTAYWRISNLLPNPSFELGTAGWSPGAGATSLERSNGAAPVAGAWTGLYRTAGAGVSYIDHANVSVTPGKPVTFSAYMVASGARPARVMIRFKDAAGVAIRDVYSAPVGLATLTWTRVSLVGAVPPAGATQASLHIEYQSDVANRTVFVDCCMFYAGDELVPYIDGSLPATSSYTFAWSGTAHASTSTRTPTTERPPEALIWRAGVSGMAFLQPLLMSAGLRLVCDEQRRWTLRSAEYRATGAQTFRYGVNIESAVELLSRAEEWFDGAVYVYIWTDRDGIEQRRVDSYALPGATKILYVEVRDTPFPGPGRAEHIVKRAQGRGRTVTVSAVPTWTERTDQPLSVLLEGTPIQTGIAGSVRYDLGADTVTISSRTTDTPAGAIDLLAGTINALQGTINGL